VLNSFHKGVSYGYRLIKGPRTIQQFDARQYPGIDALERLFKETDQENQ
jgi:hypothetical protein